MSMSKIFGFLVYPVSLGFCIAGFVLVLLGQAIGFLYLGSGVLLSVSPDLWKKIRK